MQREFNMNIHFENFNFLNLVTGSHLNLLSDMRKKKFIFPLLYGLVIAIEFLIAFKPMAKKACSSCALKNCKYD